jgi:hypothetical protein
VPAKPVGQAQVPDAKQTPEPEQAGEQENDWTSETDKAFAPTVEGSCSMSGMESHKMIRLFPDDIETHTPVERASEPPATGAEKLVDGAFGLLVNEPVPEYSFWGYTTNPG